MSSRAAIIVTIGPSSDTKEVFTELFARGADAARFNMSWTKCPEMCAQAEMLRAVAAGAGRNVIIITDLPGPRVQDGVHHHVSAGATAGFTAHDKELLADCIKAQADYVAVSYVGSAADVTACRAVLKELGGTQKIIAKIERKEALDTIAEIAAMADALMVARGDLGLAIPLEQLPFAQTAIIAAARAAGKPVIVATEMLKSMTTSPEPTRAEVNDVSIAITEGADAVMLSEESATGKYPREAVAIMERIVLEAEAHRPATLPIRPL